MFDIKKWREKNREHIREYARNYCKNNRTKISNLAKKWIDNNREKHNKYRNELRKRNWINSSKYRENRMKSREKWVENFKKVNGIPFSTFYSRKNRLTQKGKARYIFSNAIQAGKIIRPNSCSKCFKKCKPQGHHFDYSKPLEIIWLCTQCHGKVHSKIT